MKLSQQLDAIRFQSTEAEKAMSGVKIADVLKIPGATYKQDTFRVYKGVWAFRDGDWVLDNAVDITGQTTVNFTDDNFSVQLPDLSANEGIRINYWFNCHMHLQMAKTFKCSYFDNDKRS